MKCNPNSGAKFSPSLGETTRSSLLEKVSTRNFGGDVADDVVESGGEGVEAALISTFTELRDELDAAS